MSIEMENETVCTVVWLWKVFSFCSVNQWCFFRFSAICFSFIHSKMKDFQGLYNDRFSTILYLQPIPNQNLQIFKIVTEIHTSKKLQGACLQMDFWVGLFEGVYFKLWHFPQKLT